MDSRFSNPTNDGYGFQSMDEYPSASTDSTPVTVTSRSTARNIEEESTTTPGGFYMMEETKVGQFKKGRYGKLEDQYLAWMSEYLHEKFGADIYKPMGPEELKGSGTLPTWMYDLRSLPNLAIPVSYFCVGIALNLLRTPLIVYFVEDLNASAAQVNVLFTAMAVPWCFKMFYGLLSDCCPISGLRRRPYFMTGWCIFVLCNIILAVTPGPGIPFTTLMVFLQTSAFMLSDVMVDALIVERSRYEPLAQRGTMQSKSYVIRFFGSIIGSTIGAVVYNKGTWDFYLPINAIFFLNAVIPLIILFPLIPFLVEIETNCEPINFFYQVGEIFNTVQLRSVWQPMTFVYVYNAMQLSNGAWMNFLVEGLEFTAWNLGLIAIMGSIMSCLGVYVYKEYFFGSNWRIVYIWCTSLAWIFGLGQLILIFGLNEQIGIPNLLFGMGDDVLEEFFMAVQFLPMCIMYLSLCPEGSEGSTYALLTTWSNLAGSVAYDISTVLTEFVDVSAATIEYGDYSGIWKLTLIASIASPIPLLLLGLIPKNKEDQKLLQKDKYRDFWAGVLFLTVMVVTLLITFAESIYEVYATDDSLQDARRRKLTRLVVGRW